MKPIIKKLTTILTGGSLILVGFFLISNIVLAASGTIDSTDKYAWGENIGWINFGTSEGDVEVSDSELTGYAWGENVGWISLNCSNTDSCATVDYKVENDDNGNLFGYGWGENVGWINFDPQYGGVIIQSSGEFTGYAWGENTGWVVFNCSTTDSCAAVDYKVKTDWVPQLARAQCENGLDDDGDGKIDYPADPGCSSASDNDETDLGGGGVSIGGGVPTFPYRITINNGDKYSNQRIVILTLEAGSDIERIAVSNSSDFINIGQEPFAAVKEWDLCGVKTECPAGEYAVYVKFYDRYGLVSSIYSDSIILDYSYAPEELEPKEEAAIPEEAEAPAPVAPPPAVEPTAPPLVPRAEEPGGLAKKVLDLLPDFLKKLLPTTGVESGRPPIIGRLAELLPDFLRITPKKLKSPEIPLEKIVSLEAPLAMKGQWELLEREPVEAFVFAPLPPSIEKLIQKFPKLGKTFSEVGINKITDIRKLEAAQLSLPGLTETIGLPTSRVEPGKFALPGGIPLAQLSPQIKQRMPAEIIFAKTGGELIDFNITLTVDEKGQPQQRIITVAGRTLTLAVKPEAPARSVIGYLVFSKRHYSEAGFRATVDSALSSLFFAKPVFAEQKFEEITIEKKLVLMEFEYTDPDEDGIYTAEIQAPVVDGEYEIITLIDYIDPDLGRRKLSLVAVVDPEGYIFEKFGDKEIRVPGAIVSIYWLNPETKQYELWPAREYQQENPQVTDVTGRYSFLVPEGFYYINADAAGYLPYEGKPFQVKEGRGVHFNIEVKTKYWWLKIFDWKSVILIIVILFLLYNFYRDKKRDKLLNKN